jgi:SAM-dependent methyltransferase
MSHKTRCPGCGNSNIQLVGRIPATDVFAGRKFSTPFLGGALYRCRQCNLGFRWPRLSKDRMAQLYRQGCEHSWTMPPELRRDWSIARDWINAVCPTTAKILDVGCFNGCFLKLLGNDYQRYGIEIHPMAKKLLINRGIKFLGSDIDALNDSGKTFDCITAFDIIEHVASPKNFLLQCLEASRSVGHILISTGNLDAPTFRFMGSHYWYCTIAEHISFISPKWCNIVAEEMGLQVTQFKIFSHGNTSIKSRINDPTKNLFYKFMPQFFANLRRHGWGGKNVRAHPELADHPPIWESANDHFMVLFSR